MKRENHAEKNRQKRGPVQPGGPARRRAPSPYGGAELIKGTSRRVVVVQPPEEQMFEQIIYIVRGDALTQPGVSEEEVLNQAQEAIRQRRPKPRPVPPSPPREPPEAHRRSRRRTRLKETFLWCAAAVLALAAGAYAYAVWFGF